MINFNKRNVSIMAFGITIIIYVSTYLFLLCLNKNKVENRNIDENAVMLIMNGENNGSNICGKKEKENENKDKNNKNNTNINTNINTNKSSKDNKK